MRLHVARSQDECSSQRWRRPCLHFHTRHTATEYGTTGTVVTWSLWFTMTTTTSNGIAGFAAQNSNCSSGFLLIAVRFIFYFCFVSCSILLFCFIFGFCSIFAAQFSRAAIRSTLTRSLWPNAIKFVVKSRRGWKMCFPFAAAPPFLCFCFVSLSLPLPQSLSTFMSWLRLALPLPLPQSLCHCVGF